MLRDSDSSVEARAPLRAPFSSVPGANAMRPPTMLRRDCEGSAAAACRTRSCRRWSGTQGTRRIVSRNGNLHARTASLFAFVRSCAPSLRSGAAGDAFVRDSATRGAPSAVEPDHDPRHEGFLVLPPEAFAETPAIVADALRSFSRYDHRRRPRQESQAISAHVLDANTLTEDSAVVRFALREDVLAAVAATSASCRPRHRSASFTRISSTRRPTSSQAAPLRWRRCDADQGVHLLQ